MDYQMLHLLLRYGKDYAHRRIKEKGFTDTEHMICSFVYVHENCSQDDIAKALHMDKTTVGKAVDALVGKGRLLRTQSGTDRRKNVLLLTEEGKNSIADILSINDEWVQSIVSVLSKEEQTRFMEYLSRVLKAAVTICEKGEETGNEQEKVNRSI